MSMDSTTDLGLINQPPAGPMLFNEATYDRQRGNTFGAMLGSSARTSGTTSGTATNYNGRGAHIALNVTAASGTGGVTLIIEAQDTTSGSFYPILTSAAIIAVGLTIYRVYPGIPVVANAAASDVLPRVWRVRTTVGDGSSYTYSVSYNAVV